MGWFMKKTTMIINNNDNNNNDDFRPRLGMGWFGLCVDYENKTFTRFSSPAWGWVGSQSVSFYSGKDEIFVPAWGWVGSFRRKSNYSESDYFRPRLGMGWFKT